MSGADNYSLDTALLRIGHRFSALCLSESIAAVCRLCKINVCGGVPFPASNSQWPLSAPPTPLGALSSAVMSHGVRWRVRQGLEA